jgi:thioredoxin reductase
MKVGERVLVWGDHYAAVDTVSYLASIGKQVTVVTERKEFGSTVEVIHMYVMRKRFQQTDAEALDSKPYKYPVTVYENSTVYKIGDGEVVIEDKNFQRSTLAIDTVVTCHTRSNTALFDELRSRGVNVFNVGDSVSPRNLHAAVLEGASFGLNLEENMLVNPNNAIMNDIPIDVLGQLTR